MTMTHEEMWNELKEYCQKAEKELWVIAENYKNDPVEKKRVEGKADGVGTVLYNIIRMENQNKNKQTPVYYRAVKEDDDVFDLDDFLEQCRSGMFIDSDGSGSYSKDGFIYLEEVIPSDFLAGNINREYTHVVWFNK